MSSRRLNSLVTNNSNKSKRLLKSSSSFKSIPANTSSYNSTSKGTRDVEGMFGGMVGARAVWKTQLFKEQALKVRAVGLVTGGWATWDRVTGGWATGGRAIAGWGRSCVQCQALCKFVSPAVCWSVGTFVRLQWSDVRSVPWLLFHYIRLKAL